MRLQIQHLSVQAAKGRGSHFINEITIHVTAKVFGACFQRNKVWQSFLYQRPDQTQTGLAL